MRSVPLSAVVGEVSDILGLLEKARYVMVVDSCSEACAKKLVDGLGIRYDEYLNLEEKLGIKTPCYTSPSCEVVDDIGLAAGTGLMAIAPAVTPILQIPFLVGYVKAWRKIAGLWKCKVTEEEAVPGAS